MLANALAAPLVTALGGLPGCTLTPSSGGGRHVAVVGAGAFGGWTALHLQRAGCRVTLLDAWGPGNARASSGGDTRVLRHGYGADRLYTALAARSRALFLETEQHTGARLFDPVGLLWLVQDDDSYERACVETLAAVGLAHEVLQPDEIAARYPQLGLDGVTWALTETDAGILYARRSCERVLEMFVAEGGTWIRSAVAPGSIRAGALEHLSLSNGTTLTAEAYVFACGPWLGQLFPGLLGDRPLVRATRQEVFTFGVPPGDLAHVPPALPVWADHGSRFWYGIPGNERRGFKVADDTRGEDFDPTHGNRIPSAAGLARAREFLARRFPGLKHAPLIEARVCQYEDSPDGDFLADRHPDTHNAWLVGGGSGHGFKHGPGFGELVAACVLEEREVEPRFALARFGRG